MRRRPDQGAKYRNLLIDRSWAKSAINTARSRPLTADTAIAGPAAMYLAKLAPCNRAASCSSPMGEVSPRMTVAPERRAANHEVYASTLALIRQASVAGLGETAPATAFKAHWD